MDLVGQTLGQYQIVEELGRGGMAVVYKGYQPSLNRYVAIKALPPQFAFDEQFVQRFLREARAAAALHHPNIVTIHDIRHESDFYFIVMEYIQGETLDQLLTRSGLLPLSRIVRIVSQVADALEHAHQQRLIHRDIKPSNIMVDEQRNDHVTLMDFGLVRAAEGTGLTRTGMIVGTPEYMSPEQAEGEQVDNRTDIYSLGVVIFKMLTGHVPFSKSTPHAVLIAHITQEPPSITSISPSLPSAVEAVVRKAMAKDREGRYARVGELARDLTTAATGQVPAGLKVPRRAKAKAKAAVVAGRPTAKAGGKGWLWGLGTIGALLLLIACGAVAALALGVISLPTPTSPTIMSTAPRLTGPPDDAAFEGTNDNVVLEWSAETPLEGEHAYYKVVLECPGGGQFAVRHVEWVRNTQLILPGAFYDDLVKASTNECEWSVMAVEVSAEPPDEGNESPLSERSERRSFTWQAAADTTATPTRTPTATRTRQPTKSPTPTPVQTVTSTPSPAATSTRGPTTATPTTPTSPPTQPPATQPPSTQPPPTQPPPTLPPPTQPPPTQPPPTQPPPTQPPPTQPPPTQPPPTQPPPTQPPPTYTPEPP